jgi:type IV secretion system protein VirB9
MKLFYVFSLILILTGCATTPSQAVLIPAREVIERPQLIKVKTHESYQLVVGNDPALKRAFDKYVQTGKAANIMTEGFTQFAYDEGNQPVIHTTPFQETVISLEPGERFTNITSGDPNRWSYAVAVSGSHPCLQQNVLVKPSAPDIATNLVITTDRRLYNLKLVSTQESQLTRVIRFWYPKELINHINQETLQQSDEVANSAPNVNLSQLNFNYKLSCGGLFCTCPAWKPTQVFDDGMHTYIQFPASIANKDMPALFILDHGINTLVNFRSKPPFFVVDRIFKEGVLILGVGNHQVKVTIKNCAYV